MTAIGEAPARSSSRRVRLQVSLVLLLIAGLIAAFVWSGHQRREHEWHHGGDKIRLRAQIAATDPAGFGDALAAAGGDRDGAVVGAQQGFVLKVTWRGTPAKSGHYQFVLLDDRVSPAQPIRAGSAWVAGEAIGPNWAGAYEALHEHYPWLAGTADRRLPDGSSTNETDALGVPAVAEGTATLAYYTDKSAIPTTEPTQDLRLAIFFVDSDGHVRWARRVPLGALAAQGP